MASQDSPLISIIVPNFNNEVYLGLCLESILSQSHKNLEVIVVDDSSTDGSMEILQRYSNKDDRIRVLHNSKNIGVALSRDRGIKNSKGKWITTLDSDDIFLNEQKLEKELEICLKFAHSKEEVIAFSGIQFISSEGNITGPQYGEIKEGNIHALLLMRACLIPRDFLFTREQYLTVGGFDRRFPIYEDWDLKVRLAQKYKFFHSGIDGIGYRRHGSGLSAAPPLHHIWWLNLIFLKNIWKLPSGRKMVAMNFYRLIYRMLKNYLRKN